MSFNKDNIQIMESSERELTIAIPFYNAERFLASAIQSIINQTYLMWDLILLDDGSTDSSLKIANSYAESDKRIRVISDGRNMNLSYRLNQIPTLVKTKYLCRMDADDIMHPQKIEKQIEFLKNNTDVDLLGTNAYSIDENDLVQGIRLNTNNVSKEVKEFIHPTILGKTEWFLKNPYDAMAMRIEDAELWMRTFKTSNFRLLNEPLFFYREFGSNYYKKYIKGIPSLYYLIKKHKLIAIKFSIKYIISTSIYFFYSLINREDIPIINRNKIIFNPKKDINTFL